MSSGPHKIWVTVNGERFLVEVDDLDQRPVIAMVEGSRFEVQIDKEDLEPDDSLLEPQAVSYSIPAGTACEVTAPMPGDISEIMVQAGKVIKTGDPLCVLDAMKMKNTIHAPQAGTIAEVCVTQGQSVDYGEVLFRFG
jgi:biotin carboxyl carrier protein